MAAYVDLSLLPNSEHHTLDDIKIEEKITNLANKYGCLFFVDASVRENLRVGAAFFSPSLSLYKKFNLPDGLPIFYAEAFAILKALTFVHENKITSFCIVSDNSRILKDIKFMALNSSPHPGIVSQICDTLELFIKHNFVLVWLPGHCNNTHIGKTDQLAKASTFLSTVTDILFTRDEASSVVSEWVWGEWRKEWEREPKTNYQKVFKINRIYQHLRVTRKTECIINRLRLLQTCLNAGLFKIGLHPDGKCATCGTLQDCEHFIMQCPDTEKLRKDIKNCYPSNKQWSYQNLLSDLLLS